MFYEALELNRAGCEAIALALAGKTTKERDETGSQQPRLFYCAH